MATLSKRMKQIQEKVDKNKVYSIEDAIAILQDLPKLKFVETFEACFKLGVDPRKSDQNVRGSTVLPHGTGKTKRVAVFAQGDKAADAQAAGADVVGFEDLAETIKKGVIEFDVLIASPDAMRLVGPLGQMLGPKGLMPNPKDGTVTQDIKQAVDNAKKGQVRFRADKAGLVHCGVGKVDFASDKVKENLKAVLDELKKLKPTSSKGVYVKKIVLSTTMGPGLSVDISSVG